MLALRVLQAVKVQRYEIEIYNEQKTRNSGYNILNMFIRGILRYDGNAREIFNEQKTRNSGYNILNMFIRVCLTCRQ